MATNVIRTQQRNSWNNLSAGWKKWDKLTMEFLEPVSDAMISYLNPSGNDAVLDLASGTGEPGLTMATRLSGGKVVISDLSGEMLAIARDHAEKRRINNIDTIICDVCELPFPSDTFDAISCRFGFMFFPDMELAAHEMARVVKPGGRISAAVWGSSESNFWVTAIKAPITKHMELLPPPPGAPGMFRCADDGLMANLFATAGLQKIEAEEVATQLHCGTPDTYWDLMTDIAAPVADALDQADEVTKARIKKEVRSKLNAKYPNGNISIDASAIVLNAENNDHLQRGIKQQYSLIKN